MARHTPQSPAFCEQTNALWRPSSPRWKKEKCMNWKREEEEEECMGGRGHLEAAGWERQERACHNGGPCTGLGCCLVRLPNYSFIHSFTFTSILPSCHPSNSDSFFIQTSTFHKLFNSSFHQLILTRSPPPLFIHPPINQPPLFTHSSTHALSKRVQLTHPQCSILPLQPAPPIPFQPLLHHLHHHVP